MTRAECERKLIELAEQADRIYREYNPEGEGISLHTYRDGYISVSDISIDSETKKVKCWTLDGAKDQEGEIISFDYDDMTVEEKA